MCVVGLERRRDKSRFLAIRDFQILRFQDIHRAFSEYIFVSFDICLRITLAGGYHPLISTFRGSYSGVKTHISKMYPLILVENRGQGVLIDFFMTNN